MASFVGRCWGLQQVLSKGFGILTGTTGIVIGVTSGRTAMSLRQSVLGAVRIMLLLFYFCPSKSRKGSEMSKYGC